MLANLLIFRWILLNTLISVGIFTIWYQGWFASLIENDRSHLSIAILVIFFVAWIYQGFKTFKISKNINAFKQNVVENNLEDYETTLSVQKLLIKKDKDLTKIKWMSQISGWLVLLGLIGTIIGFVIALSGVPQGTLSGTEGVEGIQNSVTLIIAGMHVALYTTLAGAISGLILEVNTSIIHTALSNHWSDLICRLGK